MPSITLNQVKYVLTLAKTGSFSVAAEQCFVTQSTLSTMVKKMETQLDLQLFDRKSKPIVLTQEGLKLIDQFTILNQEYENLLELIQETNEEFRGTLKIGIIPTLAPFLLPLFLDKLVSNYPKVNFSIKELTTEEITQRIRLRELDIGILSLPIIAENTIQKVLFKEDFLIYDLRNAKNSRQRYKISEIDVNRLWLLEESHCLTSQIEKICHLKARGNTNLNLEFVSGSILSLLELVHMNKGMTLLPRLATLQKNLINPKYVSQLEKPIPVREIGVITHTNFTKKRLLKILGNEISQAVKPIFRQRSESVVIHPF